MPAKQRAPRRRKKTARMRAALKKKEQKRRARANAEQPLVEVGDFTKRSRPLKTYARRPTSARGWTTNA